jgi:hypothetical protein
LRRAAMQAACWRRAAQQTPAESGAAAGSWARLTPYASRTDHYLVDS